MPKDLQVAWSDLECVTAYRLPRGGTMIGCRYRDDAPGRSRLAAVSRAVSGVDGALDGQWPGGAPKMAAIMEEYRRAAE